MAIYWSYIQQYIENKYYTDPPRSQIHFSYKLQKTKMTETTQVQIPPMCCAPECNNPRMSTSHCVNHHIRLNKIYLKYKSLQSKLLDTEVEKLSLDEAKRSYTNYYRVYKLRMYYMQHGFKPELRDEGHKQMAENLYTYMDKLAKYMERLTANIDNTVEDLANMKVTSESSDDEEDINEEEKDSKDVNYRKLLKKHKKVKAHEIEEKQLICAINAGRKNEEKLKTYLSVFSFKLVYNTFDFLEIYTDDRKKVNITFTDRQKIILSIKILEVISVVFSRIINNKFDKIKVYEILWLPVGTFLDTCCVKRAINYLLLNPKVTINLFPIVIHTWRLRSKTILYFDTNRDKYNIMSRFEDCLETNMGIGLGDNDIVTFTSLFVLKKEDVEHEHIADKKECEYCTREVKDKLEYGTLHPK